MWLQWDLREHSTLQSTVESRFVGLVANVDKQQCQLCCKERMRSRVHSLGKQALRVGSQYGKQHYQPCRQVHNTWRPPYMWRMCM